MRYFLARVAGWPLVLIRYNPGPPSVSERWKDGKWIDDTHAMGVAQGFVSEPDCFEEITEAEAHAVMGLNLKQPKKRPSRKRVS
jgi:hypothetical protein